MALPNGTGGYQVGPGADEAQFAPQKAPVAYTGTTVTLAASDLANGLVTSTNASAVGFTLPTAALMDAECPSAGSNTALEFVIINLGSASGAVSRSLRSSLMGPILRSTGRAESATIPSLGAAEDGRARRAGRP